MYTVPDGAIQYDVILGRPLFQTNPELGLNPQSMTITHADTMQQLINIQTYDRELVRKLLL